ncbi:MAG: hypothetical protein U0930_17370 [Pirellulales bacterium]
MNSNDSHFLASFIAGQLSKHFEFESVAWIGRFFCWLLLTIAWHRLGCVLGIAAVLRPLTLAAWLLLVRYGHFAGEWFVGGFEAKSIAYPLAIIGLSLMIEERWSLAWMWLGAAVAFHPVVGGWIIITLFPIWFGLPSLWQRARSQAIGIAFGVPISFIGILPALGGFGSPDREGVVSAGRKFTLTIACRITCARACLSMYDGGPLVEQCWPGSAQPLFGLEHARIE